MRVERCYHPGDILIIRNNHVKLVGLIIVTHDEDDVCLIVWDDGKVDSYRPDPYWEHVDFTE